MTVLRVGLFGLALSVTLTMGSPARAQTGQRSALTGRVLDATGAALEGARVTLDGNSVLGGATTVVTDRHGRYRFTQLLPGDYVVEAVADGFERHVHPSVALPVETTWTIDFRLDVRRRDEIVHVTTRPPLVDVTTAASPAILERALLQNVPTDRSLVALLNLAPGVTESVAFGGQQHANGLQLDGVDLVEPVLGRPWVSVSPNWIEAVQVVALGAAAEHGQVTGATANIVLRSGGNRLSGLGESVAAIPGWTGNNTAALEPRFQTQFAPRDLHSWWDLNGQAGGPLRRDHVWLFAGVSLVDEAYRPFGYAGPDVAHRREPQWVVKADAAVGRDVRIQGFFQREGGRVDGEQLSAFQPTLATAGQRTRRNHVWHGRATWSPTGSITLEARIGGFTGRSYFGPPDSSPRDVWPRIDQFLGTVQDSVLNRMEDDRRTVTGSLRAGSVRAWGATVHDVVIGLELEATAARVYYGFPGDRVDNHWDGAYVSTLLWPGEDVRTRNRRTTVYAQDRWRLPGRITLEPGLRAEWYGGRPRNGPQVFRTTPVAVRLGAAWDVTPEHRTVLRAHYGRYHDRLFSQIYSWHDREGLVPRLDGIVSPTGEFLERSRTDASVPAYPIAGDLKQSHVDQWTSGLEHHLARNLAVEIRYVARRFGNFIGYVDRRLADWSSFTTPDPGPDGRIGTADDGGQLTGYIPYWWPDGPRDLVIANPDGAMRRYDAVQVLARKRASDVWEAQASYTLARTRGTIPGQEYTSATYSALSPLGFGGTPAAARPTPTSRSPFDYRELKLLAWARLPGFGGTMVAGVFRHHNGQRWHRLASISDAVLGWSTFLPAEEPFSRETPSVSLLDVRVEKTFALRRDGTRVGVYLDALNAVNIGRARQYIPISGPNFGRPRAWTSPRTMRLGLRCAF